MPLSWNEIRDRAVKFSRAWESAASERAEAQTFWNEFFEVFGVSRRRVATFEEPVKRLGEKRGRIDAFWKGHLVVEHKSKGENLDRAFQQAIDYFPGIAERDLPKYILVSDFARLRLYDLDTNSQQEFDLRDLHKRIKLFGFIAGYAPQEVRPQDPVNIHAAEQMGRLHDQLKAAGYTGHPLEVFLVRLVFCLFADDTGIFQQQTFRAWLEERTAQDGSDLGPKLAELFQVLNTPKRARQKNLDEQLNAFDYINGRLFEEALPLAQFDAKMRVTLLDCCALNWGAVSPAIFGALFQAVMDEKQRRNLGAHYTSEENILKLIKPLFLDDLWNEFGRVKGNRNRLFEFHKKLRRLIFLDPACGCGNFLVITYRELRRLELDVLRAVHSGPGSKFIDIHLEIKVDVDQFYGIEIEEWPAQIAQVAMWLIDHQMNTLVSEEFGLYFARIPLVSSPHIVRENALRLDWNDVVPAERLSYIISNPPFVGAMVMSDEQRADMAVVFRDLEGYGVLDYVSCWYWKAAAFIAATGVRVGFVSTNSISQGEQVGLLWAPLMHRWGIKIHFAHRTFRWSNEAKGVAAVHCVIIGFGPQEPERRQIFEYESPDGEPHSVPARNINAYLLDAPDVFLVNRSAPISPVPPMRFGSMPRDGGHLILSEEEKSDLLKREPKATKFVRPYTGAEEFLNGYTRWCLWLMDATPEELRRLPMVMERVEQVRQFRLKSKAATTRRFADTAARFCQLAQPETDYLLVPRVSSERRHYIPVGFVSKQVIANDQVLTVSGAALFHFGVISSQMHMAWARQFCGRLESRYRYSKDVVYNNFPWPEKPADRQTAAIEAAAQAVLDARALFPKSSLADLYDPLTMPPVLVKAHRTLDRAADAAYGKNSFDSDPERVAFLLELYQRYTSLFPAPDSSRRKGKRAPPETGHHGSIKKRTSA
jgi:MmeI, DNA-methyltransferase domain/MmeI, target recognition domain/MmeI, N-terminal domain/MmeI, C-terminal domain/MmeI, helicase spacer domain